MYSTSITEVSLLSADKWWQARRKRSKEQEMRYLKFAFTRKRGTTRN